MSSTDGCLVAQARGNGDSTLAGAPADDATGTASPEPPGCIADSANGTADPEVLNTASPQNGCHNSNVTEAMPPLSDPDYEVPEGHLTETQVVRAHAGNIHVDKYGFLVSAEEAAKQSASAHRSQPQQAQDVRHIRKWRKMLGHSSSDFQQCCARKHNKVKRRVRKGIPDQIRGLAWHYMSGNGVLWLAETCSF